MKNFSLQYIILEIWQRVILLMGDGGGELFLSIIIIIIIVNVAGEYCLLHVSHFVHVCFCMVCWGLTRWRGALQRKPGCPDGQQGSHEPAVCPSGQEGLWGALQRVWPTG